MQVKSTNKEYQELGLSRPSPPLLFCSWVVWASRAASGGELGAHPLGANKTRIFQRAFAQMCPPRTATTFPFFYPVFPFKGTKSACKNEREKKKKKSERTNPRTKEKGREGRDRREREGEGAWSLSSQQSPSQAKAPPLLPPPRWVSSPIWCAKDRALGVAAGGARPCVSRSFSWVGFGVRISFSPDLGGRLWDWWASSWVWGRILLDFGGGPTSELCLILSVSPPVWAMLDLLGFFCACQGRS